MGKAWQAPRSTTSRARRISKAAVARYREVCPAKYLARPDWDIANLVDELIGKREPDMYVTDCNHPEVVTHVYHVDCESRVMHAVERGGCVVTLLNEEQVKRNLGGNWVRCSSDLVAEVVAQVNRAVKDPAPASGIRLIPVDVNPADRIGMTLVEELSPAPAPEAPTGKKLPVSVLPPGTIVRGETRDELH